MADDWGFSDNDVFVPRVEDQREWSRLIRWKRVADIASGIIRLPMLAVVLLAQGIVAALEWFDERVLAFPVIRVNRKLDVVLKRVRAERREWRRQKAAAELTDDEDERPFPEARFLEVTGLREVTQEDRP